MFRAIGIWGAMAGLLAAQLVRWIRPALELAGDYEFVDESLARLVLEGCGAARQRAAFARHGGLHEVVAFLAAQTRP